MSRITRLAKISTKGGFNLFWGVAASSTISAVGVILVARFLTPSEYGLFAVALVVPQLIHMFKTLGMDQATIKYTAQYHEEDRPRKIKNILASVVSFEVLLGLALSVVCFLLSGVLASVFHRPEITPLVQIASFSILGEALFKASQSGFTGYEKMEFHSTSLIIRSILKSSFMILLVLLGWGVYGAVLGTTISYLVTGTVSLILLYFTVYRKLHCDGSKLQIFSTTKKMLRYGIPLSLSSIFHSLLKEFYTFLIALFLSDQIIGNYEVAVNFTVLISFFVTPVNTVLFPLFSKLDHKKEPEVLRNVFQFSVKYASLLVVPVTFLVMTLSRPAVYTLFGEDYQYAPLYLSLYVILYLKAAFGNLSYTQLLKGQEKTKLNLKLSLLGVATGITLSVILIPPFGIFGLLAAHLTSGLPSLMIGLWWIRKHYHFTIHLPSTVKILFSSACAALLTYGVVSLLNSPYWTTLILGGTVYSTTYLILAPLMGAINQADTQNLKKMLESLGPLGSLLNIPLNLIEKLYLIFQKP